VIGDAAEDCRFARSADAFGTRGERVKAGFLDDLEDGPSRRDGEGQAASGEDDLERAGAHRLSQFSGDEREASDCVMICVSRSCTPRLILDL
jgi:hypothetical protein